MSSTSKISFAEWQEHLDFLLPRREMLRPDEIAAALEVDEKTVIRLFESRQLHGHEVNATKKGRQGDRQHRRYRRDSVIIYLAETANYTPHELRLRLLGLVIKQPLPEQILMYQALGENIRRGQS